MANIYSAPSHKAQIGYNGFDMSQLTKFSSTVGELLPVYFDILEPADKITASIELKTRTQHLAASAMCNIKEHVEWFFVPITQLYSIFGDWRFQIQDVKTSLISPSQLQKQIPYLPPSAFNGFVDDIGTDVLYDYYFNNLEDTSWRIFELLGVPVKRLLDGVVMPVGISPLLFCAYQKIYFDYYRLTEWEANDPTFYNLDAFYSNPNSLDSQDLYKYATMRYRPQSKNFFNTGFSSPLLGATSVGSYSQFSGATNSSLMDSFNQWLLDATYNVVSPSGQAENTNPTSVKPLITSTFTRDMSVSPTSIRTSFAIQKMLEVTRRSGKHYDKQVLAHYGCDVPEGIAGEVMYLGSQHGSIQIGDVIATSAGQAGSGSSTVSSVLGQVGGKGYGYIKGETIKFTAPCHGVLMAIFSAEPDLDYEITGVDRLNTLINLNDWYIPEYDNLGMQPLWWYQIDIDSVEPTRDFLHYQYRYMERKTKFNRNCGNLSGSLSYWTTKGVVNFNPLKPVSNYLVNPRSLDPIMLVSYNPGQDYDSCFETDPLFHQLYCDVKKASKMSTYGLESL